ncbi:hypothetical protein JOF28_002766 [Leucobacter exalbidus]|uniref:Tetratricopeptide repeat protein n=1 Tax=Leucobacter exalbidus TaxID=662960 RepID=A0A940PY66_9MICO|nr:hypothetical protein [Leucobacter exalbidus]MBP1327534.1 hypothetical protein [Leucobacter exalbidus]
MTARVRALLGVALMSVLLVLYFVFTGVRAVGLLATGGVIPIVMGLAMLILPLIGVWALLRELQFGRQSTALVDQLDADGALPEEIAAAREAGTRPDRDVLDAAFGRYKAEAEAAPDRWQSWLRLGLMYDACGDRKRARAAIRQAISVNLA